jgi:hypothetical protein
MKQLGSTNFSDWGAIRVDQEVAPGVYWAETRQEAGIFVELDTALKALSDSAWDLGTVWNGYLVFGRESGHTSIAFAENPKWARELGAEGTLNDIAEINAEIRDGLFNPAAVRPGHGRKEKKRYRKFKKLKIGDEIMLRDVGTYYTGAYVVVSLDPLQGEALGDGELVEFQQQQFDDYFTGLDELVQY